MQKCNNYILDSRLIVTTNNSLYDLKLVDCGDYIQVYIYETKKIRKNKNEKSLDLELKKIDIKNKFQLKDFKSINTIEKGTLNEIDLKNITRSKLGCQRLVKCNIKNWKSFITLTIKENITDIATANKMFRNYIDTIKRVKKDFMYIAIPEFQKRGAIHYHLLTNLECGSVFLPKQPLKRLFNPSSKIWKELEYYNIKYWQNGYSSAEIITGDIKKIIGYISKYMTKDIDNRLFNRHRYFYSRNLKKPFESYININNQLDKNYYKKIIQDTEIIYQNIYINPYDNNSVKFLELLKK